MSRGADLFVTGMVRSGTTLLEKLLCNHPELSVASQPFPYLWIEVKRRFLAELGFEADPLPLSPLFPEPRYTPEDFAEFLRRHRLSAEALARWLDAMRSYSGQRTRVSIPRERLAELDGLPLAEAARGLHRAAAHRREAIAFGAKEVRCEEYLLPLLHEGFHAFLIVRDPRDVIASMRSGRGREYVGEPRPLLFELRSWRRSVTHALALADHPRFRLVHYEELVRRPEAVLEDLTESLGVDSFPAHALRGELRDQRGQPWRANSSHGEGVGISNRSVGAHRRELDELERGYVETLCFPEMRALGYATSLPAPRLELLDRYADPAPRRDGGVPPDLAGRPEERALERRRWAVLAEGASAPEELVSLFRFPSVAHRLARAARTPRPADPSPAPEGAPGSPWVAG